MLMHSGGDPANPRWQRVLAFAILAAGAVAAIVGIVAVTSDSDGRLTSMPAPAVMRSAANEPSCAARVVREGRAYVGTRVDFELRIGGSAGTAVTTCNRATISVDRVEGVDPAVGLLSGAERGVIYIAAGRCVGYIGDELKRCLTTILTFEGRMYTATRFSSGRSGDALGTGRVDDRSVSVLQLKGVDSRRAVAVSIAPGDIFIAEGVCQLTGIEQLERCLEA